MNDASPPASRTAAIETPCVKVCALDEASTMCVGCGRTRSEIARWSSYTPAERRRIMGELPDRLKKS